jgi:hypothetical protein
MTKTSYNEFNLQHFREYLHDAVIEARGEWDAKAAKFALLDGEWLGKAGEALGIYDDRELEALASELYDECTRELEAPARRPSINALPALGETARELAKNLAMLGSYASIVKTEDAKMGTEIEHELRVIAEALARIRKVAQISE